MDVTEYTLKHILLSSWDWSQLQPTQPLPRKNQVKFDLFGLLRKKINQIKITNAKLAHKICQLIPAQCPFHRKISILGKTIITIPPLCKLNPLYEELMALRFRALCYLVEECQEEISQYC